MYHRKVSIKPRTNMNCMAGSPLEYAAARVNPPMTSPSAVAG